MEIEFYKPELKDKELFRKYYSKEHFYSCERTFTNIYLWQRQYPIQYAIVEDTLVFKPVGEDLKVTYPAGEIENVKKAVKALKQYSEEQNKPLQFYMVTPDMFAELDKLYPGELEITYDRDVADYVYEMEKLKTLSGKKLHSKRNHINKFKQTYPDWKYETITSENVEECFQMALAWRRVNGCEESDEKIAEVCVTLNSLRLMEELDLTGGLLRVNGKVAAFSIGEPINEDTFVVHIEKAFTDVEGAYTVINQQFVENECQSYTYINREEDTGAEGLRKAKLSYKPVFLVEKGSVVWKNN